MIPEESVLVEPAEWTRAITDARGNGYDYFDWLTAVDRLHEEPAGFDVVCHLLATDPDDRPLRAIRVTTRVPDRGELESITGLFRGAAWHERETHEMFGLGFSGFDDGTGLGLRPLLLPDGFTAHPLRKDFHLAARASKPWPGGKEPGEGHESTGSPSRRRVQAPGVPPPEWGPR